MRPLMDRGSGFGVRVSGMVGIALLLFTIHDSRSTAFAAAERVEEKDTNEDGKPDEWRFFAGEAKYPHRVERDRDGDGRREVVIFFEEGKPARSEVDRNGDGKADIVQWMKQGRPDRQQADLDFDGRPDAWSFFKDGFKDLMIMDKNKDGKPDAWFYYGHGGFKMTGGSLDEDFDGTVDRSFGNAPEKEERTPF